MMFPDLERARPLLCHAPLCFGPGSFMIFGLFLSVIADANGIAFQLTNWPMLAVLVAGLATGYQIKYRSTLSVRSLAAIMVYIVVVAGLLMGTALLSAWSLIEKPASSKPYLLFVFLYHATILTALALPFALKLRELKRHPDRRFKNGEYLADTHSFTIDPNCGMTVPTSTLAPATIALTVNLPIALNTYIGKNSSALLIAASLYALLFSYVAAVFIGPKLAYLYELYRYERQTGRRFVNQEYEKVQALRRTFLLYRLLAKLASFRRTC
ncbi:hypothetical protein [Burkholderia ubonensis]|uniref:Uncharacterized protein n=1 Tax=Burkholderia ubonensis TaxID=101571 RepID=A0AB74D338_9BURK|nr:hypothetical protein [Burkholderia ubonensis]PAJ79734.1 hypothetical protein CJO71_16935 [Burkholderia ubonensis]PAJ86013.1 hypothetical protein CJO70_19625 [Burkholderia ubonensis]PAJ90481.1 hypothetical protein CJO69_33070 [Burkholderia ubonensis]PAK00287.1 hypothetical protein CJO68_15315 [Burkholderia ubonensis]PAK06515.1 hypothetical protein CJO67_18280 [Burkholderia ubonensis]